MVINEVLAVNDQCNLTGAHLVRAAVGENRSGRGSITLTLDEKGGQLLSALISRYPPDPVRGQVRCLGIILDRRLYSTCGIDYTISRQVQMSGSFAEQDARDLVNALNSGPLPVPIRPVEKQAAQRD